MSPSFSAASDQRQAEDNRTASLDPEAQWEDEEDDDDMEYEPTTEGTDDLESFDLEEEEEESEFLGIASLALPLST